MISLRTALASCLSPPGQISSEFVDLKQSGLCKYCLAWSVLYTFFLCSSLRYHSLVTDIKYDICMIATDLLIEEGNKRGIKHFSFLNSSVTFSSTCYWFYYWVWLWLTSLLLIQCNAPFSLVPTCLYSFIFILICLISTFLLCHY